MALSSQLVVGCQLAAGIVKNEEELTNMQHVRQIPGFIVQSYQELLQSKSFEINISYLTLFFSEKVSKIHKSNPRL